jgi:hypothetical protein
MANHFGQRRFPSGRYRNRIGGLRLHVWRRAPHIRQANPADGCLPQLAHRVVSCDGGDAKDGGQPLDLPADESSVPAVAVAFGGAHGGGASQPISPASFA